ncbi:MAG: hypothetical protein ACXWB5_03120 [Kaistella sp.]
MISVLFMTLPYLRLNKKSRQKNWRDLYILLDLNLFLIANYGCGTAWGANKSFFKVASG